MVFVPGLAVVRGGAFWRASLSVGARMTSRPLQGNAKESARFPPRNAYGDSIPISLISISDLQVGPHREWK
jgi:hypothetical protein